MEQVEDQVYLTAKEVTHLLEQATQSITDDLLADAMRRNASLMNASGWKRPCTSVKNASKWLLLAHLSF